MEITQTRANNIVLLGLKGRLDASTANSLEEKILALLDQNENQLLVDFSNLVYISSAGLRVLLMAAKKLKGVSGKMALCALRENVKEIFDLAGFTMIFSIHPSPETAMKDFS
jgi:anti-anti-sigma factor